MAGAFITASLPMTSEVGGDVTVCACVVPGMAATESPMLAAAIATRLRLDIGIDAVSIFTSSFNGDLDLTGKTSPHRCSDCTAARVEVTRARTRE
jgi:hypothetical protein